MKDYRPQLAALWLSHSVASIARYESTTGLASAVDLVCVLACLWIAVAYFAEWVTGEPS